MHIISYLDVLSFFLIVDTITDVLSIFKLINPYDSPVK